MFKKSTLVPATLAICLAGIGTFAQAQDAAYPSKQITLGKK